MKFICWSIHCILIALTVAFFTLFERKTIGLFHNRLGPNKVSFIGLLQPLLDAFKFFLKQNISPISSNKIIYSVSPVLSLVISFLLWLSIPFFYFSFSINYSILVFFCLGSFIVFGVLLAGWSSNSKYSLVGRLRSVAQSISYESVFSTLLVLFILLIFSFSVRTFISQSRLIFIFLFPVWFICSLAEAHRSPFDFRESESELVSGYNTEYSSINFALVILAEYGVLVFSCVLIAVVFFSFITSSFPFLTALISVSLTFFVTWVRITYCRFRYDILIIFSWKVLLPFSLSIFLFYFIVLIF